MRLAAKLSRALSLASARSGKRLENQACALARVARLGVVVGLETRVHVIDTGGEVRDALRGGSLVSGAQEVGAEVARLDRRDFDIEMGDLLAEHLGQDD